MIRGKEQPFKFTTAFDFDDICNIDVVWSQSYNDLMPIVKCYNRQVEKSDGFDETTADTKKTYYVGTQYYRYDTSSEKFVASNTKPTESDIIGGTTTTWPLGISSNESNAYKCEKSYYQYNPSNRNWDITSTAPDTNYVNMTSSGVKNLPANADEQKIYEYKQRYYRHNGTAWVESTDRIVPIAEVSYWDKNKESTLDISKTYCALETYYKYINNAWSAYGVDCMTPIEVYAWNSSNTSSYDKSKIYMMKELYYQYNPGTDTFEKTDVREVYYKYNAANNSWEECEADDIVAEEIDLWVDEDDHDTEKTYVCRNVYYRYNVDKDKKGWEGSNNMLVPVIEIDEWETDNTKQYDTNKVYTCPAKYYQYNIEAEEWEEKEEVALQKIINLDYWTDPTDLDKYQIYLCGTTYFQYDSENEKWASYPSFNMQLVQIDYPSEATDESKVYECSPIYYTYSGDEWAQYKNAVDAVRNDGFAPVDGDPKSFITVLSAAETMLFNEKYKGKVQARVYCDTVNLTDANKIEYFTVYPTLTDEITGGSPSDIVGSTYIILDGGEII